MISSSLLYTLDNTSGSILALVDMSPWNLLTSSWVRWYHWNSLKWFWPYLVNCTSFAVLVNSPRFNIYIYIYILFLTSSNISLNCPFTPKSRKPHPLHHQILHPKKNYTGSQYLLKAVHHHAPDYRSNIITNYSHLSLSASQLQYQSSCFHSSNYLDSPLYITPLYY